jgi:hypothetical protein
VTTACIGASLRGYDVRLTLEHAVLTCDPAVSLIAARLPAR